MLYRPQKVFETVLSGRACIVKERVKKSYRLPVLDKKLSHRRLVQEARCIMKCRRAGVSTPAIFLIDEEKCRLFFEKIEGGSVKEFLRRAYKLGELAAFHSSQQWEWMDLTLAVLLLLDPTYGEEATRLAYQIGVAIARMHDADIVHGDLTTSNMMLSHAGATDVVRRIDRQCVLSRGGSEFTVWLDGEQTMIDFGLANSQPLPEDKAVDLYVMERAFASTHINSEQLVRLALWSSGRQHAVDGAGLIRDAIVQVAEVLRAYKACSRRADATFQKLAQVRLRGRKRTMVG